MALAALVLGLASTTPARGAPCTGDCDRDGIVGINEVLQGVGFGLTGLDARRCARLDVNHDGQASIDELVAAVGSALGGCPTDPEIGPLVCGTSAYVDGTFVWTDYAYDDHGANTDAATGGDRTHSEFAGGDFSYPTDAGPGNAADLIQLQIGLRAGAVSLRALLETLVDRSLPVLGVAFDVDANPETGAATMPGDQWPGDGPLGIELFALVSARVATLQQFANGSWRTVAVLPASVRGDTNVIETELPRDLAAPNGAVWRAFAALGIDTADGSWVDGVAPIYDLAFVGNELLVRWQENRQADIVAGALASAEAAALVDFGKIAAGVTELPPIGPGFHTFLYHAYLDLPEGVDYTSGNPIFNGPYQPYALFIPDTLPSPAPLALFLHGLDQNHVGAIFVGPGAGVYFGTARAMTEDPYLVTQFAPGGFDFAPPTLQAYPLARGEGLFYIGIAHQDVLDVLDDVTRRFAIDPDRVALQGGSMGGIGTYRIGALQPHRWSAMLPLIGFQTADLLPLSANLLNVPVRQINGGVDPLIAEPLATASAARLDELEYDYRYWLADRRGHEGSGPLYQCVFEQMTAFVRIPHPARVFYTVDAKQDQIDPATGLALRFDSAYWVSEIRVRDEEMLGSVDATSVALPRFEETITHVDVRRDNFTGGADLCGPNPAVMTEDTWRERAVVRERGALLPAENALTATLTNLSAVTFDLAAAAVDVDAAATLTITSDGETQITFAGLRRAQAVLRGGVEVATADEAGRVVVLVPSGGDELQLGE